MQPATNRWPATDGAKHVLLVAQNLREMLTKETYESFRVQTLDVLTRFREVRQLIKQLQNKEVRRASLIAPIEELASSINLDPVAREIATVEIDHYEELLSRFCKAGDVDLKKLRHLTEYVESDLETKYKSKLEAALIDSISEPQKKID